MTDDIPRFTSIENDLEHAFRTPPVLCLLDVFDFDGEQTTPTGVVHVLRFPDEGENAIIEVAI